MTAFTSMAWMIRHGSARDFLLLYKIGVLVLEVEWPGPGDVAGHAVVPKHSTGPGPVRRVGKAQERRAR